jgi:hypothetical protein
LPSNRKRSSFQFECDQMDLEAREQHEALVQRCGRWQRQSADAFGAPQSTDNDPLYMIRPDTTDRKCWCKSPSDDALRSRHRNSAEMNYTASAPTAQVERLDDHPREDDHYFESSSPAAASGLSRCKPERAQPASISRRRILSRLNAEDFGSGPMDSSLFHCSTMLRRSESQPTFTQATATDQDELDDDELFGDYGESDELNADLNGNFRQMNLNSNQGQLPIKRISESNGKQVPTSSCRGVPIEKATLNKNKSGSAGTSISCSSDSIDRSAGSVSPVEASKATSFRALPPISKPIDAGKATTKAPMQVFSRKQTVQQWANTGKWDDEGSASGEEDVAEPEVIEADGMQSELYNSEHSASITQLKEITNLANNQVVLSTDQSDDNTWHCKKRLFDDHIAEIVDKWPSLDSEIWCKVICMERNRRVAKAYIRLPYLIVTGAQTGFDGYTIGLSGFVNSHRDPESAYIVRHLDKGVRIKMDETGNLLMRRMCEATVQIKDWLKQLTEGDGSLGDEVIALHGRLPLDRAVKVFDMTRFERNLHAELNRSDPDVRRLADQCILPIAFGKNTFNLLNSPCWLMAINVIALRMISHAMHVRIPEPDYFSDVSQKQPIQSPDMNHKSNESMGNDRQLTMIEAPQTQEQSNNQNKSIEMSQSDDSVHIYNSI